MSAPEPIWVELTEEEEELAAIVGHKRHCRARHKGWRDVFPDKDKNFSQSLPRNINGAAGEVAVAKLTKLPWTGRDADQFGGPDVGNRIQVRTRASHSADLMVRAKDSGDDAFVLATGDGPYAVRGYMWGREAKAHPEWKYDEFTWFVPPEFLHALPLDRMLELFEAAV